VEPSHADISAVARISAGVFATAFYQDFETGRVRWRKHDVVPRHLFRIETLSMKHLPYQMIAPLGSFILFLSLALSTNPNAFTLQLICQIRGLL
jgi:hypothetical protein